MSTPEATVLSPARPELVAEEVPTKRPGWVELATSADHKSVGLLFIGGSLAFLFLALVELILMRLQLAVPENTLITPVTFNRLLSMYGATGVFLFALPFAAGLISYIVPLQIGSRGVALPRLNLLGAWLFIAGGATLYLSFLYTPSEAGVNPLPPLSDNTFLPSNGVDTWIAGVGLATLGLVCFSINLVTTLRTRRAPGMAWRRVPLFSWAAGVFGWLMIAIGPVLLAALTMLFIDRHFSGVFFDSGLGGAPILWQHLTWIFFTGAYLAILITAFGAISEILPVFARKPSFAHRTFAGCFVAIAALGTFAWMQNMYTAPIGRGFAYFAMAMACLVAIPVGIVFFNWIATLTGGTLRMRAPLLFALGAISTIAIGLTAELCQSVIPVNEAIGNTTDATAATHYALVGASIFGGFAALHYWFPKITGRTMAEGTARLSFWLTIVGVNVTFAPMFLAGVKGQPVDLYRYFSHTGLSTYNLISTIGAFVLGIGIMLTLVNVLRSANGGARAGHDPWGGNTLEWFALSPPPEHNFDVLPDVRSAEPLRDIREAIDRGLLAPERAPEPAPVAAPAPSAEAEAAPPAVEPAPADEDQGAEEESGEAGAEEEPGDAEADSSGDGGNGSSVA